MRLAVALHDDEGLFPGGPLKMRVQSDQELAAAAVIGSEPSRPFTLGCWS